MKKSQYISKGFTLIELLVVIAVISLLASVVLVALNSTRIKARDTKRKADLSQINKALAFYYDEYGRYPDAKPNSSCQASGGDPEWAHSIGNCGGQWLTADPNFYKFMAGAPKDPLNTGGSAGVGDNQYVYSYFPSGLLNNQDYELLTQLENQTDPDRCATRPALYHNIVPNPSWCDPLGLNRSQSIYTDH